MFVNVEWKRYLHNVQILCHYQIPGTTQHNFAVIISNVFLNNLMALLCTVSEKFVIPMDIVSANVSKVVLVGIFNFY